MSRIRLPSIDALLADCEDLIHEFGRQQVTRTLRDVVSATREALLNSPDQLAPSGSELIEETRTRLTARQRPSITPVFNLTGTVLHTNLGRAVLPDSAIAAMSVAARSPVNLEYDIAHGSRGDRDDHVEHLLCELTGAEAATVVNNNAAAVLLLLNTIALGKEVVVSRGELVEIGGSFRIPEIMDRAGCRLTEVGATNRTHAQDYRNAINEATALLMKVHTSNYEIRGFTASVPESALVEIAAGHGLPVATDLGSGSLVNLADYGLPPEPVVKDVISGGADLVTFSGDKLLGGPQCGVIVGRRDLLARIKSNPLKRALRVDKIILSALEAVLRLYLNSDQLATTLPTLRALTRSPDDIEKVATRIQPSVAHAVAQTADVRVTACMSQIGSGAMPGDVIESAALAIKPHEAGHRHLARVVDAFRGLPTPVIGRVHDGEFLLDLRTMTDPESFIEQLDKLAL